ncbi:uncharacterized protein VTP21DRAFT_9042 [Calcarisporiella thermophila]|uniref:uncharacterized protein n=1 Tax=Calcarisporiella thermophila TaxID=911321 RepID=UPI003742E90B
MRILHYLLILGLVNSSSPATQDALAITTFFVDIINSTSLSILKDTLNNPDPSRVPALEKFQKDIERIMEQNKLYTITETGRIPPNRNNHYYYSFAPYWWPDCQGIENVTNPEIQCPYVRRDGQTNPDSKKLTSSSILYDFITNSTYLAVAYKLYENNEYAQRFEHLVDTFFLHQNTYMEPNLTYAQVIRGPPSEESWIGRREGIIDTRHLITFSSAISLIKGSSAFSSEKDRQLKAWFRRYASWVESSKLGRDACNTKNNHATYCLAQRAAYWSYAGDYTRARAAVYKYFSGPFHSQFEADGSQPEELARSIPLHYSMSNLEALTTLAKLGEALGVDIWHKYNKNGANIQTAVDFVLPMAMKVAKLNGRWKSPENPARLIPTLYNVISIYGDPTGIYQSAIHKIRNATDGGECNNILHLWRPYE